MAHGYEIVLGFKAEKFEELKSILDIDLIKETVHLFETDEDNQEEELGNLYDIFSEHFENINLKLEELYPNLLKDLGFHVEKEENGYFQTKTKLGYREMDPFKLQFYFEPYEFGENFNNSIIGINLSSRYNPTLLDWENENGTLWNFSLNEENLDIINKTKEKLAEVIPEFKKAEIIFRDVHY